MRRRSSFASVPRVGRLVLYLWWKERLPLDLVKVVHHGGRAPFYKGRPL